MQKSVALTVASVTASLCISTAAHAVTGDWTGPSNLWSNSGSWVDGVIPNGVGDIAQCFATGASKVSSQNDTNGVTVGTLRVYGDQNASWQITPNQNVFLNADGNGPGHASVINDIQTVGANNNTSIFLNPRTGSNPGAFWLQDDLHLINNSTSVRNNGSIQIRGSIRGAGNITIVNNTNDIAAGQIQFTNDQSSGPGAGGFGGNIFINKGAVTFQRGDVFTPTPGNIVTIGEVGSSADVTIAFTGGGLGNMENGFVVAATNPTANLIFAANATAATNNNVQIKTTNTNAAAITLNGNLSFDNRATNGSIFIIGDVVQGAGRLTTIGPGPMRITNTNTYSGGTIVNNGSLAVGHAPDAPSPFGFHAATNGTLGMGHVMINSAAMRLEIESFPVGVTPVSTIADTATLLLAGGGTAGAADQAYLELGASINEVVGGLILGGAPQTVAGTYGSTSSGAMHQNDEYFSGTGMITLTPVGPAGDYNGNGAVDAADYVLWRKNPSANGGDPIGYHIWRAYFGDAPGAGSGLGNDNQAVPEPAALLLTVAGVFLACVWRRSR